jgi:Spy/CpxP family protein refolding chaperone
VVPTTDALLCDDCGRGINQDEYPAHDECIRARFWDPASGSRIDDVCELVDRINETMRGLIMADKSDSQRLFDSLTRAVEQQKQADEEHRQALLDHVREETARQRAERE